MRLLAARPAAGNLTRHLTRLASGSAAGVQRLGLRNPERRHCGGEQRRQHPDRPAGPLPGDIPGDRRRRLEIAARLPAGLIHRQVGPGHLPILT